MTSNYRYLKRIFLKRSFSYEGVMAWIQLSNQMREIRDLAR